MFGKTLSYKIIKQKRLFLLWSEVSTSSFGDGKNLIRKCFPSNKLYATQVQIYSNFNVDTEYQATRNKKKNRRNITSANYLIMFKWSIQITIKILRISGRNMYQNQSTLELSQTDKGIFYDYHFFYKTFLLQFSSQFIQFFLSNNISFYV